MGSPHLYRQKLTVLLLDILAFLAAFAIAMHLRFDAHLTWFEPGVPPWGAMLNALPVVLGAWLLTLWVCGLYDLDRLRIHEEIGRLLQALFVALGIILSIGFFYRGFSYSRGFTLLFIPLMSGLSLTFRFTFRALRARILGLDGVRKKVLLVGDSPVARHLAAASKHPHHTISVVGALDDHLGIGAEIGPKTQVLGRVADLAETAKQHGASGIIITTSKLDEQTQLRLLDTCLAHALEWQTVPSTYELMLDRVRFDVVAGVPVLGLKRSNIRGLNRIWKRAFDVVVASAMIFVLSPLFALIALLVKLTSKGPVFYSQDRVGEGGTIFKFHKFRSMRVNNDDAIHREYAKKWIEQGKAENQDAKGAVYKIKKDPRVTAVGAFIRKYSIDELPQLFNVLKGDMSLIGPRPPIPYEVEVYREWHRRRLEGPQGITGLWQVSGRNRLSFDEMVKLDIEYIENWSLALDLKILWRTVGVVLFDRAY